MATQECCICTNHLIEGFDEIGYGYVVVRLESCGHIIHRDCISDWWEKQSSEGYPTSCPSCKAAKAEGSEGFQTCYFPGGDDGSGRINITSPQDTLCSFNPATRKLLGLWGMMKELRSRLSAADQGQVDSLLGDLDPGTIATSAHSEKFKEVEERLMRVVERVGQMWAEGGTRNAFERMNENYEKWKAICEGFQQTRKAVGEYERIKANRNNLKIKLEKAMDKNKEQAIKTVQKIDAAREEAAEQHTLQLEQVQRVYREDFAKANNRWMEKNGSLQAQVNSLGFKLLRTEGERDAAKEVAKEHERAIRRLQDQLVAANARLSNRKPRDAKIRNRDSSQSSSVLKRKDLLDDSSDAQPELLEVTDAEDEELSVLPPDTFSSDKAPNFLEPTRREFKVPRRPPLEVASRKKEQLGAMATLPRPSKQSNAATPRSLAGRPSAVQKRVDLGMSITSGFTSRDQRTVSDLKDYEDQPAPSAQLASGPRYQSNTTAKPGATGRELLKRPSSDVFLDNTNRSHGDKKRIRAI